MSMVFSWERKMRQKSNDTAGPEDTTEKKPSASAEQSKTQPSTDKFHPIEIGGEPLSATILRERR
jgi:hypothetical protein